MKSVVEDPISTINTLDRAASKDRYPCSNAVIEALACGLPVLYLNDGGHPELVGLAGLPFEGTSDLLVQLEKLVNYYELFQSLIVVPGIEEVSEKYLSLLKGAAEHN